MRIVSLLPAATDWLGAMDALDHLVGRSHLCELPAGVADVPVLTRSRVDGSGSAAIDQAVRARLQAGLSLFDVDLEGLRALRPELILTQAQCDVCAVSHAWLEEALADWTGTAPRLFSMEPMTFKQVLDAALRLGREVGAMPQAMRLVGDGERRLQELRARLGLGKRGDASGAPSVACIEWMEPLMTGGHWMPDVVELAGGRAVLAERGRPSAWITWEELRAADPDVVAVMPCGFSMAETRRDLGALVDHPAWRELRSVREGRVYLFDGQAFFNRPGPRLYRSVELMAAALHPGLRGDGGAELHVEPWEMQPLEG